MTELLDMTNNVLNIVLNKEDDYYSYFYKKIKDNNNDMIYYSNILANNLLHVDFNNYLYDEVLYILDCATSLINYTINLLENKETYSKEDIKILDFSTIQFLDIYSDILEDIITDEQYQYIKNIRKYKNTNEQLVNSYLEKYYNKSQLIKLIYVYDLIKKEKMNEAIAIYNTYENIEKNHPFYPLANNINKIIIDEIKKNETF